LGNEFLPFASVETIGHRNQNFGGNKPMRKTKMMIAVFVVGTLWVGGALAQDTNAPLTKIEIFEARTGTVIVRGSVLIGTMSAQTGTVSVRAKEDVEPGLGAKAYGIAVGLQEGGRPEDATMVDYDELDSFLSGIDYIRKANPSMTPLPEYDVGYTTAGWLRLVFYTSIKHPGTTQIALQSGHASRTRILLSSDQLAEFQNLIQQAKTKLDSLRAGK
jgi:hypothetical protein